MYGCVYHISPSFLTVAAAGVVVVVAVVECALTVGDCKC